MIIIIKEKKEKKKKNTGNCATNHQVPMPLSLLSISLKRLKIKCVYSSSFEPISEL